MELKNLALPALNRFASDYMQGGLETEDYFHYSLSGPHVYKDRYEELMSRTFMRKETAAYIEKYMARFPESGQVKKNIERLKDPESAVVVGGQQAGLLTGPLYTIHKVISIVKLAEEQTEKLGKPVIPVFWIAGEDHDLAEVNHVYTLKNGRPAKTAYPLYHPFKTMVSDLKLDQDIIDRWIDEILETYGETAHTSDLRAELQSAAAGSASFTEFFAALIHQWFSPYGLLLLDAADPELRRIEAPFFAELIDNSRRITEEVLAQQHFAEQQGYTTMIEIEENAANLFYYTEKNKERVLLEHDHEGYAGRDGTISLTKEELLETAANHPERMSNNVVTRPIMQEKLFPVLAFISGPGEVAYWAELKRAFELLEMKMPPIVPRLNITIVERGIQTDLEETRLDLKTVLTKGTDEAERAYFDSVKDSEAEDLFRTMKTELGRHHQAFADKAAEMDKGLRPLLDKNRQFLDNQLDFIYGKVLESTQRKHEIVLNKYKRIANALYPLGSPQERMWNIAYYLNQYGPSFIADLMKLDYEFNHEHKVIFL